MATRHFVCAAALSDWPAIAALGHGDRRFYGIHPWAAREGVVPAEVASALRMRLENDPAAGVGEIGLDRLRERDVSPLMRELFAAQLEVAAACSRPVVLHGAKCWGEVVKAVRPWAGRLPALLFHGFSRSEGLVGEMVAMGGYVSVGPSILNDHAVNYRELAKRLPLSRLLVETDRTEGKALETPGVEAVARKLAEVRAMPYEELSAELEANAERFLV